ncbi:hypothetical protein AVEN_214481-1 [Araneus ventricosus]|uniref:Secreted protein n=1 Tax=Araneus ventricosus TaxID=182803 RepID=A0A4Y2CUJ2_ARAVE|nr:hypothetical protein AVEN_214481-1 [Araneus ventricosus]
MGKIWFFLIYGCHFECLALSLTNAVFKGDCCLMNWDSKSCGIIRVRGIKTLFPLSMTVITVARTTFGPKCVICNRVPLRSLGTSRLRINSTGTPTLILSLLEGTPNNSKELKNSTGYDVTCCCPLPYLQIDILYYLPPFMASFFQLTGLSFH